MRGYKRGVALGLAIAIALGCSAAGAGEIPTRYQKAIEAQLARVDEGVAAGPYKPDWKDLGRHTAAPEWFRDAKFGIYWHWGVYAVPAYGNEWYPKWMHTKKGRRSYYKHHVETYGEPDKFGYHDFVPMFKAEHFDAEAWAELIAKAGARYAGPVCEHHDGFAMWASELTPWNAGAKGPKRDITGELAKAIRKRGMRFVTTFHHERTRTWYPRVEGWPTTSTDPELRMLYANVAEELFNQIFLAKLGEVIGKYQPDLIWFDGQMTQIQTPYHLRFLACYFNRAAKWGRDVVVTTKKHQYPPAVSVEDFEKGRMNRLTDFCWLTDDTISLGSWCYTANLRIKPASRVLHDFIDIVSKNGCLLLNISPKSDGTIPAEQRRVLLEMGAWLKVNGEAIYSTRPWLAFGEGPSRVGKSGSFTRGVAYTWRDVRYTRSKDGQAVYAIVLGWPEGATLALTAPLVEGAEGGKVELLGYGKPLTHKVSEAKQLVIGLPALGEAERPSRHACVLKLTGFKLALNPKAAIAPPPAKPDQASTPTAPRLSTDLTLDAAEAGLSGPRIRVEAKVAGQKNIGNWSNASAQARWRVQIKQAGRYVVHAVVATTAPSKLAVAIGGRTLVADVPRTGAWDQQRTIELGTIAIEKTGECQIVLRPADRAAWKAVNVWKLTLAPAK